LMPFRTGRSGAGCGQGFSPGATDVENALARPGSTTPRIAPMVDYAAQIVSRMLR
jgi:hypothetical protein